MTNTEVWDGVSKIISESLQVPIEKVVPEARLVEDLDIDSLYVVQLTMEIEEKFEIQVGDEDIPNFKVVNDIVSYVETKVSGKELA